MAVRFEWDNAKAASNLRRHGISFLEAVEVFSDEVAIEVFDASLDYGEDRYIRIGLSGTKLLAVVYTEPQEHHIRIISARPATKNDQQDYHRSRRR